MAQTPYAYDKHGPPAPSATRFWLGIVLLFASLILIGLVLWQLRLKKEPLPEETGVPALQP